MSPEGLRGILIPVLNHLFHVSDPVEQGQVSTHRVHAGGDHSHQGGADGAWAGPARLLCGQDQTLAPPLLLRRGAVKDVGNQKEGSTGTLVATSP